MKVKHWPLGAPVAWQALSNSQREAQRKHGKDNWVVARESSHTIISGETCVLIAPLDKAHEARWVRETQVISLQPAVDELAQQMVEEAA